MFFEDLNRRVLPRWRDHRTTLVLGELFDSKDREPVADHDREALVRRASEWRADPTLWNAADLVSSAFVVGVSKDFKEAADFILDNHDYAPVPLVALAKAITLPPAERVEASETTAREIPKQIHELRKRLQEEPRNAIQWVELSRLYTLSGEAERAIQSMGIAVSLAPHNRFIVRSAARLFHHEHDAGRALRIIRAASGAKTDPWLLAAEIAVASATNSPSLLAKIGRHRSEDESLSPFERTELSSALGTIELENGKNRHARQFFRKALVAPNENSLAQAEWANRRIGGLEVEHTVSSVPRTFEASAHLALANGEWEDAIAYGLGWFEDQPFSKQPAVFTSYVSSLIEKYERSIRILRASLKLNPHDPTLVNNLAFALASNNQVAEAVESLHQADPKMASGPSAITLVATQGLVLFRTGFPQQGRRLYEIAMQKASSLGEPKYRFMAELYLAREELLADVPDATSTADQAVENSSKSTDREVALLAGQIRLLCANRGVRKIEAT